MSRRLLRTVVPLVVLGALIAAAPAAASPEKVGPPNRVTALGDSITRGYNSQGVGCSFLVDCPQNSWATGTNAAVNSVLTRIKTLNPAAVTSNPVRGNDAVTGARAAGLAGPTGQAQTAIAGNPDLVMILIGANDVCTSSQATMTSTAAFRASIEDALGRLSTQLPDARIAVSSIPNIYNLWDVLKGNASARFIWGLFGICQSMLANPLGNTAADVARRNAVRQRNIDFNTILQEECAEYIHCRYDGGAAFALNFLASDVSTQDYFHPNTNGQVKAALTAWNSGPSYADLTAPTTTISRDRSADGVDDWYKDDVEITISATDPNSAVSGSEYFYKLVGEVDKPWTKYTGPFTISAEGQTDVIARSVDVNGNIEASKSDLIKIDRTAPTFDYSCTSPVQLNGPATATISNASDNLSGFDSDPNGSASLDTSIVGSNSSQVEIQDRAGNTATQSCTYAVNYVFSGVRAPINQDGSSIFKLGSTVPVKFGLTDANGVVITSAVASISVAKVDNNIEGTYMEATSTSSATTGNLFRVSDDDEYIFNLGTKGLTKGTYSVRITLDDGSTHSVRISLK